MGGEIEASLVRGLYGYAADPATTPAKWTEVMIDEPLPVGKLAEVPDRIAKLLKHLSAPDRRSSLFCFYGKFLSRDGSYEWTERFCTAMRGQKNRTIGESIAKSIATYLHQHLDATGEFYGVPATEMNPFRK